MINQKLAVGRKPTGGVLHSLSASAEPLVKALPRTSADSSPVWWSCPEIMSSGHLFRRVAMTYTDERGTFILRWSRRLKNGHIQRAVGKPFKIYISK